MNDFAYYSPTKFVFGRGATDSIGAHLSGLGFARVLVVYGKGSVVRNGTLDRVRASVSAAGVEFAELGGVRPNPEVDQVRRGIELACEAKVDAVLPVGGGSTIDAAKAIAFGSCYEGDVWDFFSGKATIQECLPVACVLTIPAAGSEGSNSCVVSNDALGQKRGTNSDLFRPVLTVLDPELTFTLPAYQTAAGVTDMVAHICERFFSGTGTTQVTENIATGLIRALVKQAPVALAQPDSYDARADIMWAGVLAHNDLAGCGLSSNPNKRAGGWESHGLEHELSAYDPAITHGAGLAVIMPAWMRYVWREDPQRFLQFGSQVFGIQAEDSSDAAVEAAVMATIDTLQNFFVQMGMPKTLGEFGLQPDCIDALVQGLEASKGSVFGGFKKLTMDDARAIYESAF